MTPENKSPENEIEELSFDGGASLEDFIKELEAKEKDLQISNDLVVEIEESDIEEPETAEILKFLENYQETIAANGVDVGKGELPVYQQNIFKLENEVERLRNQITKFEAERLEVSETARRRQYDFDNYRKRTERERVEVNRNLLSNVATEILPVLDNLSRALDSASNLPGEKSKDFQQFVDGISLVNQQLNEVLEEMGIQPILSVGEPFDPNFHEAVSAEQSDNVPPHTVIAEILRGYRIDDKIIRHSLVKVSSPLTSQGEIAIPDAE